MARLAQMNSVYGLRRAIVSSLPATGHPSTTHSVRRSWRDGYSGGRWMLPTSPGHCSRKRSGWESTPAASAGRSRTRAPRTRSVSGPPPACSPTWASRCAGPTARVTPRGCSETRARCWWRRAATRGRSRRSRTMRPRGRMPRYTRRDEYAAAPRPAERPGTDAGRAAAGRPQRGVRRRQPPRRPRGRRPGGHRRVRQEHAGDHAPPRIVGRAGRAGHRRRARADARRARRAGLGRLRPLPGLHRRLSDRCHRRRRRARRAPLSVVPVPVPAARASARRGVRGPGLRLRHLPGRLPVEPRRRAASRRSRAPTRSTTPSRCYRTGWRPSRTIWPPATGVSTSPTTTAATCSATRDVALANLSGRRSAP